MAYSKVHAFRPLALIAIILVLLTAAASSVAASWHTMTSFSEARRMRVFNDTVYVVTSGGLLAIHDPNQPGEEYNNLDGLGTVDITDMIEASDGSRWMTGFGRLIDFRGASSIRHRFADSDGDRFALYTLEDDGDNIWVGTEYGLILFSRTVENGQILDSYGLFGNLNPSPDVYDIELTSDSIWVATSAGFAVAGRTYPDSLKAPDSWKAYGLLEYPELSTDTVLTIKSFESDLYVGTANGFFVLDQVLDTLIKLPFGPSARITDLVIDRDTLFVYSNSGFACVKNAVVTALATTGMPSPPVTGTRLGALRFMGARDKGIYYGGGSSYTLYPHTGMPDNVVNDVTVSPGGRLTVLFRNLGPYEFHGDEWIKRPIQVGARAEVMEMDSRGWNWVGTFGGDVSRVGDTVAHYDNYNSTFQGEPADTNAIICFDLAMSENYVFGTSWQAYDGYPVAIGQLDNLDSPEGWTSLGRAEGINDTDIVAIDYYDGVVAVGSSNAGMFYYYTGPDPFNKSDDSVVNFSEDNGFLISDIVRVVRFSPTGQLWVGTNFGVSWFDAGVDFFRDFNLPSGFGPDITDIEIEDRGNVWIGARNGLARVEAMTGDIEIYTTDNSDLVNDRVNDLTIDRTTGDLYVSSPSGITVIPSSIGPPTTEVDKVYAFPNPYVIRSSDDLLNFNFAGQARLRIFTVAGELVAERPQPVWNGRNDQGERVASGVYLFVLTDAEGNVGRGKFLLVRD